MIIKKILNSRMNEKGVLRIVCVKVIFRSLCKVMTKLIFADNSACRLLLNAVVYTVRKSLMGLSEIIIKTTTDYSSVQNNIWWIFIYCYPICFLSTVLVFISTHPSEPTEHKKDKKKKNKKEREKRRKKRKGRRETQSTENKDRKRTERSKGNTKEERKKACKN